MLIIKSKNSSIIALISVLILASSCVSKKNVLYLQDVNTDSERQINYTENKIQINDILSVRISSLYPEAAIPYNSKNIISPNSSLIETIKLQGNLVSNNGSIILPILGEVKAIGKSTTELEADIKNTLETLEYLKNPVVSIRVLNSKITILGEVNTPGTYNITEQNVSLLQSLGYAGDLTINGNRKDILIVREINGKQITKHIDLTKSDWFDSSFYFVKQNDVIIINPNNAKIKSSGFIGNFNSLLSITSIILSAVILFAK